MDIKGFEQVADKIAKSEFFKKHARKSSWTSGSSTEVAPIMIHYDDCFPEYSLIEIQLDSNTLRGLRQALDKLIREIGSELVKDYYLCKYDGSCPNTAKIHFK